MAIQCAAAEHGKLIKKRKNTECSWVKLKAFPTNVGRPNKKRLHCLYADTVFIQISPVSRVILCHLKQVSVGVRLSVRPSVDTCLAWRNISLLTGEILMKLSINIYHESGVAGKVFKVKGQRSRLRVQICECIHFYGEALKLTCIAWLFLVLMSCNIGGCLSVF